MAHEVQLPECIIEHKLFHDHLKDAPAHRDKVVRHEEQLLTLFNGHAENKKMIEAIFNKIDSSSKIVQSIVLKGVLTVIVAVVLGIIWTGRYMEKIDRLDKMHPVKTEVSDGMRQ